MFTLFKVLMAKCILIIFLSKRKNKQASNHGMFAAHKLLTIILTNMRWSWHVRNTLIIKRDDENAMFNHNDKV
jgi:hypothetical protein